MENLDLMDPALHEELDDYVDESEPEINKHELFKWDRYDWMRFDPKEFGYNVIRLGGEPTNRRRSPLSGQYFSIVDLSYFEFLTEGNQAWYPHVNYSKQADAEPGTIVRIAASRCEGPRKARKHLYMHRVIADVSGLKVGDHINGLSLDNRNENLRPVSESINNSNVLKIRPVAGVLLPGVEWRTEGKIVGGIVQYRGKKYRSPKNWPLEEQAKAHEWYNKKRLRLFGQTKWVNADRLSLYPTFPPLKAQQDTRKYDSAVEDMLATF